MSRVHKVVYDAAGNEINVIVDPRYESDVKAVLQKSGADTPEEVLDVLDREFGIMHVEEDGDIELSYPRGKFDADGNFIPDVTYKRAGTTGAYAKFDGVITDDEEEVIEETDEALYKIEVREKQGMTRNEAVTDVYEDILGFDL